MVIRRIRSIWNPAQYHGFRKKRGYFEGWYYKSISADASSRHAIIPGIFKDPDPARAQAFVQILDGISGTSRFYRYAVDDFWAATDHFEVRIGPNHFTANSLTLDLDDEQGRVNGQLSFGTLNPWPVLPLSPGVMGPFAFIPIMEGFHGILSFDHRADGHLTVDGTHHDYDGGRGYIEKDWGRQFPVGYVWLQTNHFAQARACLTASVAVTKLGNYAFRGFIIGFWIDGDLYRFCTYTGARIEHLDIDDQHVTYRIAGRSGTGPARGRYVLHISAQRAQGGLLKAPYDGDMIERVAETLTATAAVKLVKHDAHGTSVVFDDVGRYAGLEVVGDLTRVKET